MKMALLHEYNVISEACLYQYNVTCATYSKSESQPKRHTHLTSKICNSIIKVMLCITAVTSPFYFQVINGLQNVLQ